MIPPKRHRPEIVLPGTTGAGRYKKASGCAFDTMPHHHNQQPRAVRRLAERFGLPAPTAAMVAELAGVGGVA